MKVVPLRTFKVDHQNQNKILEAGEKNQLPDCEAMEAVERGYAIPGEGGIPWPEEELSNDVVLLCTKFYPPGDRVKQEVNAKC